MKLIARTWSIHVPEMLTGSHSSSLRC